MSMPGREEISLRCAQCQKPFGFAVAYCPFCGVSQLQAAPARLPSPRADPPPPQPAPPQPAPQPPFVPPQKRPKRRWGLFGVLAMAAIGGIAELVRPGPMAALVVSVSPAAPGAVMIDGQRAGRPGESLRLPPGPHSVGFAAEGWLATPRQVVLQAGRPQSVALDLTPQPAVLALSRDPPDAVLRLDDRLVDARQDTLSVPPGRHRLTAAHPGYAPFALSLLLERGERRAVPVTLAPLVVKVLAVQAPAGSWSDPVALPPKTDFTLALGGRVRLRLGQEVFLAGPGGSLNLGDVHAPSLQVKAVGDQPVEIRVFLKPEG